MGIDSIKTNNEIAAEIVESIRDMLGENQQGSGNPAPDTSDRRSSHEKRAAKRWNRVNHDSIGQLRNWAN